jgi:hypothetical protein
VPLPGALEIGLNGGMKKNDWRRPQAHPEFRGKTYRLIVVCATALYGLLLFIGAIAMVFDLSFTNSIWEIIRTGMVGLLTLASTMVAQTRERK